MAASPSPAAAALAAPEAAAAALASFRPFFPSSAAADNRGTLSSLGYPSEKETLFFFMLLPKPHEPVAAVTAWSGKSPTQFTQLGGPEAVELAWNPLSV